ncbi:MAG: hypothetical protein GWN58_67090 [Anaerolineae bacterium]|nr:hypothetical protein [Anaerolineae bacterium]
MPELHINDTGASLVCLIREDNAALNIGTATSLYIHYKKPDSTTGSWSASLYTDGSDGKMFYETAASSDLNIAGWWELQPAFTLGAWSGRAETKEFEVLANL